MAPRKRSRLLNELADEIVNDILVHLSVKTLSRFKCVCKRWNSDICSLNFQEYYYHLHAEKDPRLLLKIEEEEEEEEVEVEVEAEDEEEVTEESNEGEDSLSTEEKEEERDGNINFTFSTLSLNEVLAVDDVSTLTANHTLSGVDVKFHWQSSLGLVCMESVDETLHLFNPSTEELITLPPIREGSLCIGFGYVTSTKEFKIVRFMEDEKDTDIELFCQVFTLGTDNWREASPPPFSVSWSYAPFLRGAVYLMPGEYGEEDIDYIVAFDMETEEYRDKIRFPDYYYNAADVPELTGIRLTELQGALCLTFGYGKTPGRMAIWLLKDNNGQWVKEYDIDLFSSVNVVYSAFPLLIMANGTIMMHVRGEEDNWLLSYDPKDKIVTHKICNIRSAISYVESFFPYRRIG